MRILYKNNNDIMVFEKLVIKCFLSLSIFHFFFVLLSFKKFQLLIPQKFVHTFGIPFKSCYTYL